MKKRIALSFMMIALVATLVGGATFAYFTNSASNVGNTFTAGTLAILADDQETTTSFNVTNMAPGDNGSDTVVVKNNGSLALKYNMTLVTNGELFVGNNPVVITVKDSNGTEISDLSAYRTLASGAQETLTIEYSFPSDAGDEYQGDTGSFSLTFNATQTNAN
ncbi:TasA family protein [Thermincola ferriacetica]